MKHLTDAVIAILAFACLYFLGGWWKLFSLVFFFTLFRDIPVPEQKKKRIRPDPGQNFVYEVTHNNTIHTIACECPVQIEGNWAHFTDEITEFGFHSKRSFYAPGDIKLMEPKYDEENTH